MLKYIVVALAMLIPVSVRSQEMVSLADSLRKAYKIPALSYAVVSADSVYEIRALGVKKINSKLHATLSDRFRIGSNTKAITGYIAAILVKEGKIKWDTRFFDLYPELKSESRKEHYNLTLLQLLAMRTKLFPYTYTYKQPVPGQFKGDENLQRYQFTEWFLKHELTQMRDSVCFSNLGYVAAALMLEKVTGKTYAQLLNELGKQLDIDFQFGQPNAADKEQVWGHNEQLIPEAPANNQKLNWLQAAGNINATLPDYVKFVQLQLKGLAGKSDLLTKEEFSFLHYGLPRFAVGWFWGKDDENRRYSYNVGNPGTFLTKVYVYGDIDRAFIIFVNAQTDEADRGTELLLSKLIAKYGH